MKKHTISDLLRFRFLGRIATFLVGFLAAAMIFQYVVIDNPKSTKATDQFLFDGGTFEDGVRFITTDGAIVNRDFSGDNVFLGGSGKTYVFRGVNKFANLTIRNGAVVTHDAYALNDDPLTSNKRVDIQVTSNVTLESGGIINVNGRGYPGGTVRRNSDGAEYCPSGGVGDGWVEDGVGYGDTAGKRMTCESDEVGCREGSNAYGGGGAMAGDGADSDPSTRNSGGIHLADPGVPIPGGGGGGAYRHDHASGANDWACGRGGNGGGIVSIKANGSIIINDKNSSITANGANGVKYADDDSGDDAWGGGGGGGSIYMQASKYIFNPSGFASSAMAGVGANDGATNGELRFVGANIETSNGLSANGGNAERRDGGGNYNGYSSGGGGGRIVVQAVSPQNPYIKKQLTAENVKSGNPYALQIDDQVKVSIEVSNLIPNQQVDVKDDVLAAPGGAKCAPPNDYGSIENDSPLTNFSIQQLDGNTVHWVFIARNANPVTLIYHCKVRPN